MKDAWSTGANCDPISVALFPTFESVCCEPVNAALYIRFDSVCYHHSLCLLHLVEVMIWAAKVKPGKPVHTSKLDYPVRLANVALVKLGPFQEKCTLVMEFEGKDYTLCVLTDAKPQQKLDLLFDPEDELIFKTTDGGTLDLVGSEEEDDDSEYSSSEDAGDTSESSLDASMSRMSMGPRRRARLDAFRLSRMHNKLN